MDRRKLLLGFLAVPIAALAKRIPAGPDFACGGLLSPGMAVGTYTPETIIPRKLADEIFVRDESTCYYPDGRSVRYAYSYQLDSHGYPMNLTPHRIAPDGTITFSPLQAGKEVRIVVDPWRAANPAFAPISRVGINHPSLQLIDELDVYLQACDQAITKGQQIIWPAP